MSSFTKHKEMISIGITVVKCKMIPIMKSVSEISIYLGTSYFTNLCKVNGLAVLMWTVYRKKYIIIIDHGSV